MNDEPNDTPQKLSGAELRAKLKEEYKRELLARKQWLEQAKQANRTAKLANEMSKLEQMANLGDSDDTDEWIRRLNEVSALSEAKLELALDAPTPETATPLAPPPTSKSQGDELRTDTPPTTSPTEGPETGADLHRPTKSLGDTEL
ncbi:MAG: hypothetical protein SFY70_06425 [Bacteroidia bacterium]|nr:hypothetical protein [Bacteroidia bacterium]